MATTDDAVFTFDTLLTPEFTRTPQPYFRQMRATNPVMRTPSMFGDAGSTVFVGRGDDVETVLRDPQRFSSKFTENSTLGFPLIPITVDPPDHHRYRRLLDPLFGPKQMARLEGAITERANALIDAFAARGECDVAEEFAVPLPCGVFLDLMGLPSAELDTFVRWKDGILRGGDGSLSPDDPVRVAAQLESTARFEQLIEERRAEPQDDLLSVLVDAEIEGTPITQEELLGICHIMLIAGLDTVTDSLTCFFAYLAEHPEQRQRIVDDPSVIPAAVEELLRYESPVPFIVRVATGDTEVRGVPVAKGDHVVCLLGSADTDEQIVPGADTVDFDREGNRHFAFGVGIHRCLGSHLARLELRIALAEWHRRIPHYRVPDGVELAFTPILRQVEHLPLEFSPA
ncbi:MAG: cytochrome P450 [Acidimicrobiia bacterium]